MRPGLENRIRRVTARGRAMAESRMLSTWLIQSGPTISYDPDLGEDVTTYATEFVTKGRLRVRSEFSQHTQQGGAGSVIEVSRELHIPIGSPHVPLKSFATCVLVDASSDPTLLYASVYVEGPSPGDQTTAHRFKVTNLPGQGLPEPPGPMEIRLGLWRLGLDYFGPEGA